MAQDMGKEQVIAGGRQSPRDTDPDSGGRGDGRWKAGLACLTRRKWSVAANVVPQMMTAGGLLQSDLSRSSRTKKMFWQAGRTGEGAARSSSTVSKLVRGNKARTTRLCRFRVRGSASERKSELGEGLTSLPTDTRTGSYVTAHISTTRVWQRRGNSWPQHSLMK